MANKLIDEQSPYLLQHAFNPVDWHPWGDEAFLKAKTENKPLLVSIGYSACHWCHVMEHESFEDDDVAAYMNEHFVCIKVDREEHPDVDHLYMDAVQAIAGNGGWPLNVFVTPDRAPFYGGTYYPPRPAYNRPSWMQILNRMNEIWQNQRGEAEQQAGQLVAHLRQASAKGASAAAPRSAGFCREIADNLLKQADKEMGGFGNAPKFPGTMAIIFLLEHYRFTGYEPALKHALRSLDAMIDGGIYDQLAGGFARYATDRNWLVPHFEKMLYDNAQLLDLFALAYEKTGEYVFGDAAADIVGWLRREMRTEGGAFSASLDADSEGVEGKFYVWTKAEIVAALGADDADYFCRAYDVSDDGNWTDQHTGITTSILNRLNAAPATPADEERLVLLRGKLLDRRSKRVRPGLDDKILADWNGLMIAALVNAGLAMHQPEWVDLARTAFDVVVSKMTRDSDELVRLGHSFRAGRLVWPGMASDHANMMRASLALAEAGAGAQADAAHGPARYLSLAGKWAAILEAHHLDRDVGVLATAAEDSRDVVIRTVSTGDDATPNANAVYASALIRMAALTGDGALRQRADLLIAAIAPRALAEPDRHAALMNALDFRLCGVEILIAGPQPQALMDAALDVPFLNRTVRILDAESPAPSDEVLAQQVQRTRTQAAAFVCAGERCSLPITEASDIALRVREMAASVR